jgi:hypothetical protein
MHEMPKKQERIKKAQVNIINAILFPNTCILANQ